MTRVGNLQNATKSPSSPVLGHRNPNRQSSKKGNHAGLYVAEGNLPLPFGKLIKQCAFEVLNLDAQGFTCFSLIFVVVENIVPWKCDEGGRNLEV